MRSSAGNHCLLPPVYPETIPTTVNQTGSWRFLTPVRVEKTSPCRQLCPLENGIPLWMNKVRDGDWEGAWSVIKQYNPFPAITGYTCYQPCRQQCSRGAWDEAINIGAVEKAVGLWRHKNYGDKAASARDGLPQGRKRGSRKVAVVGSGPAGLSCAYYLNCLGAEVTVLEKLPLAGGLLATGIPEYRLPRDILQRELEILQSEGVIIRTGLEVGKDIGLSDLEKNFDAVLLAVGAQESRPLKVAGEELPGVTGAVDFLAGVHLGKGKKNLGRVVVVGGGNAAVDAACTAMLQGAEEVTLLYRRSAEELPAHPDEISAAREAGVNFLFQTVLREISGSGRVQRSAPPAPPLPGGERRCSFFPERISRWNVILSSSRQDRKAGWRKLPPFLFPRRGLPGMKKMLFLLPAMLYTARQLCRKPSSAAGRRPCCLPEYCGPRNKTGSLAASSLLLAEKKRSWSSLL